MFNNLITRASKAHVLYKLANYPEKSCVKFQPCYITEEQSQLWWCSGVKRELQLHYKYPGEYIYWRKSWMYLQSNEVRTNIISSYYVTQTHNLMNRVNNERVNDGRQYGSGGWTLQMEGLMTHTSTGRHVCIPGNSKGEGRGGRACSL